MNGAIPHYLFCTAEIRALKTPEDKAAALKAKCPNTPLTTICGQLGADYKKATRRLNAIKEGRPWTGVGRPSLVDYKTIEKIDEKVQKQFKAGDSADYETIRKVMTDEYAKRISSMSSEAREKYPSTFRKNYVYEVSRRFQLNTKEPIQLDKDRNECATSETVEYFFEHVFTKELCEGVPPQLFLNADETSIEVGLPRKIIIPKGEKQGWKVDNFDKASHITAMITINAAGDDFAPYVIAPLKRLPKDLTQFVAGGKINIGGSPNGWINDECFTEWSNWLITRVKEIRETYGFDPTKRAILLLDGHNSRDNREVMENFKKNFIEVVIFPPHLTHIMQPFDKVVARPLKDCLSKIARQLAEEQASGDHNTVSLIRFIQIKSLIDAHRVATTTYNCAKAFESCGIFPYDPTKVITNKLIKRSSKNFIQTETIKGPSFKISGRCITSDDVLQCLREKGKKKQKEEIK